MTVKSFALRAVPALMLFAMIAACSRGPETDKTATPASDEEATEVVVIASDAPPRMVIPPELQFGHVEYPKEDIGEPFATDRAFFEDPGDFPYGDISDTPSDQESPHPNRNATNSAVGLGGGLGGGGARGRASGFAHRRARGGGGRPHGDREAAALEWLKAHQNSEGFWSAGDFHSDSARSGVEVTHNLEFHQPGQPEGDVGRDDILVTGLALLAFAGSGYDHKSGDYREVCRNAVLYLRKVQNNDGCFGLKEGNYLFRHAVVTTAMAEVYGLSGDAVLKPTCDRAVAFIVSNQLRQGGWGEDTPDILTTAWAVTGLRSAKMAGLESHDDPVYAGVHKFLDALLHKNTDGVFHVNYTLHGERAPGPRHELIEEAAWTWVSLVTAHTTYADPATKNLVNRMTTNDNLPSWKSGKVDCDYWYWGSYALYQVGAGVWNTWERAVSVTLLSAQRGFHPTDKSNGHTSLGKLDEHGSWDAVGPAGVEFGRVYATSVNALGVQVYHRYRRVNHGADSDGDGLPDANDFLKAQTASHRARCGGLLARQGARLIGEFPLRHTDVHTKVSGTVAGTTVTQTFTNPFDRVIEASYTFPLPGDSAINDFVMQVGERRIIGVVRPREEAVRIYREARARGRTATLLTQNRPNIFTQSVANIEVGGEVKVEITYYQTLKYEDGRFEYVFPMTLGPRYRGAEPRKDADGDGLDDPDDFSVKALPPGMRSGMDIDLKVDIDAGLPIDHTRLRSVAHEIEAALPSSERAIVTLGRHDAIPNRDFVLRWSVGGDKPEVGVLTHGDERGQFLSLQVQPQLDPRDADITPREITFILDNSGSMSGTPAFISRKVIKNVLDQLHPDDIFNIVYFAGSNAQLFKRPVPNTPENIKVAKDFLGKTRPGGGTEMLAGLNRALRAEHNPRYLQVYAFLTDGMIHGENEIFATIKRHAHEARFFAFGTHSAPNRHLIDGIAEHGRGKAIYCIPSDVRSNEEAAELFFNAIHMPVLCDIDIDWNGLHVEDVYPARINDLFAAQPLSLKARYIGQGEHTIYISGRVGARHVRYPVTLDLGRPGDNPAIATMWARARIAGLSGELVSDPGNEGLIREITDTALDFNLMSRYTSFVAVDESRVVGDGEPMRVWQPTEMPEGVTFAGDDRAAGDKSFYIDSWKLWIGQTADGRVIVVKVEDGGAAAEAGMVPGQIIAKVNGVDVGSIAHFEKALWQTPRKVEVETSLTDNGEEFRSRFSLPEAESE